MMLKSKLNLFSYKKQHVSKLNILIFIPCLEICPQTQMPPLFHLYHKIKKNWIDGQTHKGKSKNLNALLSQWRQKNNNGFNLPEHIL